MNRRNLPRSFDELSGLRARGLVRESTVEQGDNSGPIVQRQDQEAFAARYGLLLERRRDPLTGLDEPYLYTDLVSGSDASKRPQFLQMVADAKAGAFDVLLVRETSRFARNWRQAGGYEDQLHAAGVVIAYIYEGRLSSDRAGQLQLVVNHAINEEYRLKLAENVQKGFRVRRFQEGKFSGTVPIGYVMEYQDVAVPGAKGWERKDTGRLLLDEAPRPRIGHGDLYTNAELVRLVGRLYASGRYGSRSLAAHLNLEGYRTAKGAPFTGAALRHMIERPTYAGFLSWHHRADKRQRGEEAEVVEGAWEPLWSPELWQQVQDVRARLAHDGAGGRACRPYPFRRIAVCDRCDRRMYGEPHREVPYMACRTSRERHECEQPGVRSSVLEDQVGEWLSTLRIPDDWREDLERLQRGEARREDDRPRQDRSAIERQLYNLRSLFIGLEIPREEYVGRRRALEASLEDGTPQPTYSEAVLVEAARLLGRLGELWRRATAEERQEIASSLFASVRVRDKRIVEATLARDEYIPLLASAEAHATRVAVAPPDGFEPPTPALGRLRSIH